MNTFLNLAVSQQTVLWSVQASLIMIACNLLMVVFGRNTIQVKTGGVAVLGITLTELIALTSFGHILGAGVILGFRGVGVEI
jgi:photosystem I subunit 10